MAAQTGVCKQRGRRRSSVIVEEIPPLLSSINDNVKSDRKLKFDLSLRTLLNGVDICFALSFIPYRLLHLVSMKEWQKRRVACTKSKLCFMLPDDELIRDSIPLLEILAVEVMRESNKICDHPDEVNRTRKENHNRGDSHGSDGSISELKEDKTTSVGLNTFQIRTVPNGFNSGRIYYLQAESREARDEIIEKMRKLINNAKLKAESTSRLKRFQTVARSLYESTAFQTISALLIIVNFGGSIAEAQMDRTSDSSTDYEAVFSTLDLFLTLAFTFELLLNAFANWLRPFISNTWSIFDFLIVSLSLISLAVNGMPVRLILLLRCCRVLRIFGKIPSVAKIFAALFQSLVPMINAFFIIFIIAAIYSIVGVTFLSEDAPAYFGNFSRAFVAMFRITIGSLDWWFDVFPTVEGARSANSAQLLFLISYVILVNWVFFQVSIAVLLDNFLSASEAMKAEEYKRMIKEKQIEKHFKNPLDPLILRLSKDYINDADLSLRLDELFKILDSDGSGDLSSQEFQAAMKKLDISPRIFVSDSDFIAMTKNGVLCNAQGNLGPKEFANVMRQQIRLYTQQRLSSSSEFWSISDENFTELASMKQILTELLGTRAEQERTSQRLEEVLSKFHGSYISSPCPESDSFSCSSGRDSVCSECAGTQGAACCNEVTNTNLPNRLPLSTVKPDPILEVISAVHDQQQQHDIAIARDCWAENTAGDVFTESAVLKSLPDLHFFRTVALNPFRPGDGGGIHLCPFSAIDPLLTGENSPSIALDMQVEAVDSMQANWPNLDQTSNESLLCGLDGASQAVPGCLVQCAGPQNNRKGQSKDEQGSLSTCCTSAEPVDLMRI